MKKSRESLNDKLMIRNRIIIKHVFVVLLILTVCWSSFTVYEYSRVKNDKDTLICFNKVKEIEDDDEYSVTCTGLLYKYRKYYYIDSDKLGARAFTMFLRDFKRE